MIPRGSLRQLSVLPRVMLCASCVTGKPSPISCSSQPLQTTKVECQERALAIERRQAECFGAPPVADYRKVYEISGWPWPGEAAAVEQALEATNTFDVLAG